jgi:hypothetical protein
LPLPPAVAPTTVCQIAPDYTGAVDITGLVAVGSGYAAIDGANNDWPLYIIQLDSSCKRTSVQSYPSPPIDPQDLAVDRTGTLWIADSGDPETNRTHIALWEVPPNGAIKIFRFAYPDGPHQAEAMLLDGDGRPIFITQPAGGTGPANLYEPAVGPLRPGSTPASMTRVGSFIPQATGTSNNLSSLGNLLVTGGANSPDGTRVVLRTFSDAYEWRVSGGNVVAAITKGTPTITPMPNEANGKSIAYSGDGRYFLAVSNVSGATPILRYLPASRPAPNAVPLAGSVGPGGGSASFLSSLTLSDVRAILILLALVGAALLTTGIWVVYRYPSGRAGSSGRPRGRPSRWKSDDYDDEERAGGAGPPRYPRQGSRIGSTTR